MQQINPGFVSEQKNPVKSFYKKFKICFFTETLDF